MNEVKETKTCENCRYKDRCEDDLPCKSCCNSFCGVDFDPWHWEPLSDTEKEKDGTR